MQTPVARLAPTPYSNRGYRYGKALNNNNKKKGFFMVFLDGLSLTLLSVGKGIDNEKSFVENVFSLVGGELEHREYGAKGYPFSSLIRHNYNGTDSTIIFCYGSPNLGQHLNVEFKGAQTEHIRDIILSFGVHFRLTRADIAIDFRMDYLEAHEIARAYANQKGIATSLVGDWEEGVNGRTYYIGKSRSGSESYLRLYEKGIELLQRGYNAPRDLVRLELEYKPKKYKRDAIKSLDAADLLSTAVYPLVLFNEFMPLGVDANKITTPPKKSFEESIEHMITQYGNPLSQYLECHGWIHLREKIEAHLSTI